MQYKVNIINNNNKKLSYYQMYGIKVGPAFKNGVYVVEIQNYYDRVH